MTVANFATNADDPISSFEDDLLKRGPFVDRLCAVLASAPVNSSNVFALYGEWGSGKTSVKNLVAREFADHPGPATPILVEFNPWAFSTQAELFESFFGEVSRALGRKQVGDVAAALARLGTYLNMGAKAARALQVVTDIAMLPGGALLKMAADSLAEGGEHAEGQAAHLKNGKVEDLEAVRDELRKAIGKLDRSILIVIDDVDRLPPAQVLQIFQVVRVNAALPRINFLLLLDRRSILHSLQLAHQAPDYLEKIVQFALDLPHVAPGGLREFAEKGLTAIGKEMNLELDWKRWREGYVEACQEILDTPRKIRRLLHTFRFHLTIFCQDGVPEVDIVDLFFLEVIRLYAPDVWLRLPRLGQRVLGHELIGWYLRNDQHAGPPLKDELATVVNLAPSDIRTACSLLVKRLLPQFAERDEQGSISALSTCRMCTAIHFPSYFLLTTSEGFPTQKEGVALVALLDKPDAFTIQARALAGCYGFRQLLIKLQALQKDCVNPAAISTMVATVWRLDEEDAAIDPVEGDWGNRERTLEFASYFLLRLPDATTRSQVLAAAFQSSGTTHPLYLLTARDITRRKRNPHASDCAFSEEQAVALQKLALARVLEMREADKLIYQPNLNQLLWLWAQHEGVNAPKAWLKQQTVDDRRFGTILTSFFGRSYSGEGVRYFVSRKSLEHWFTLDQEFRTSLEAIDRAALDRWQAHAVAEALRIFDDGAEGGNSEDPE